MQDKLYSIFDNFTLDTIPRSIMLLGEFGCGKHTLVTKLSDRLMVDVEDISDNLSYEYIEEITLRVEPRIYLIDSGVISVKESNVILKFLEEPLKNAIIIVLAESKASTIPTVLNRCQVYEFEKYETDYLKSLVDASKDDVFFSIATTPGKVKSYVNEPIQDMVEFANKIFSSIKIANFANALTIANKIAFKNEKDKFNFNIFMDVLLIISRNRFLSSADETYEIYALTSKYHNDSKIFGVDKKSLFDNYLINLKLLCGKV